MLTNHEPTSTDFLIYNKSLVLGVIRGMKYLKGLTTAWLGGLTSTQNHHLGSSDVKISRRCSYVNIFFT